MIYPDGSIVHYGYDKLGRMTNVIDALGETTQYKYDAVGNLKERILPNGSEMNLSGERQKLHYLHDELGSVTKVIGENGKTSAHYNYDEFGRPLPSVKFDQNWPGPDNTFGYTGYQYDVSAELWYAEARYYMPETGRFISEDPWSGTITTPTTMNPYPYVLNNTLKYVDPLGLKQQPSWAGYTDVTNGITSSVNQGAFVTPIIYNYGPTIMDKATNFYYQIAPAVDKGSKVTSQTKWQNGKTERVDVENPNPGKRPGDVHYHDSNNTKYRFNPETKKLYNENGNLAPNKVQKVLENKEVQKAIDKALDVLGEKRVYN